MTAELTVLAVREHDPASLSLARPFAPGTAVEIPGEVSDYQAEPFRFVMIRGEVALPAGSPAK